VVVTVETGGPRSGHYPRSTRAKVRRVSVVKINVLQVPEGRGEVLEQRFAARAGEVEKVDGFESFELLRPTEGFDRYLVVTRWRDEASFQAWLSSNAFQKGHAQSAGEGGGHPGGDAGGHPGGDAERPQGEAGGRPGEHAGGHPGGHAGGHGGPAATGSELWGFEIVTSAVKQP
jgi:heme oxygenase (mycobilin-producing)